MTKKSDWQLAIKTLKQATHDQKLPELLEILLTSEEKELLPTRLELMHELLNEKKTQREIAADLGISIAKITRGSNNLKQLSPEWRAYLKKILASIY